MQTCVTRKTPKCLARISDVAVSETIAGFVRQTSEFKNNGSVNGASRKTNCSCHAVEVPARYSDRGQQRSKMNPRGRYYIRLIPIHSGGQENDVRRHEGGYRCEPWAGKREGRRKEIGFTGIPSKCPMNERWALGPNVLSSSCPRLPPLPRCRPLLRPSPPTNRISSLGVSCAPRNCD